MVTMRVTITAEFQADPEWYPDSTTPDEMARVDQEGYADDPGAVIGLLCNVETFSVKVEPVEEVKP